MKGEAVSLTKLLIVSVSAGISTIPAFDLFTKLVSLPVWGVPVTSFGAAAAGAGLAMFFTDPVESRRLLGGMILGSCFFGTAGSVLLADGLNLGWAHKHPSMFAMVVAAVIFWFSPSAIRRGKQMIHDYNFSFSFLKRKKEDDK